MEQKDGTCHKMLQIVVKCRIKCRDVCLLIHFAQLPEIAQAGHLLLIRLMRLTHGNFLGESGRLGGVSPRSAGPIFGVHSTCACHAARSSVLEMGPHSSELATLFA